MLRLVSIAALLLTTASADPEQDTCADWQLGAPGGIRTPDPQIRNLMLYPAELRAHWICR